MKQVPTDREFRRIRALPRKENWEIEAWDGVDDLRPIQAQALNEIARCQGGFLPIGVGYGKTLIALLAPRVLNAERPVLLVDASLKKVMEQVEIPKYTAMGFTIPKFHAILSYNDLSLTKHSNLLEELQPDVIIADEAHSLRHRSSTRVKRLGLYLRKHPTTKFVCMSGTMTAKSIRDFSHLAKWALGDKSPIPYDFWTLENWAAAIDANPMIPIGPGVLLKLCEHLHETARAAFRCRMVSSYGVVATAESSLGTSLHLRARTPSIPSEVLRALGHAQRGINPDGGSLDALSQNRLCHQLSLGFWYRWKWLGAIDHTWLETRRAWMALLHRLLQRRSRPGRDSEALMTLAVARRELGLTAEDFKAWEAWEQIKNDGPDTEAVWLSEFLVADVKSWCSQTERGIIWYRDTAVGEKVATVLKLPIFGPGDGVALAKANSVAYPIIVTSIKAHSQGQNLQSWDNNLVLGMCGGARFQQLLARTHRIGQESDVVRADIYQHTHELVNSFGRALRDAQYIEETTGETQRLAFATKEGF